MKEIDVFKCSETVVPHGFPPAGANVGGKCSACPEAAGPVAQGGWTPTQRNCGLAQYAQLDLQTPPPFLSPQGVLQEEPAQTGRHGNFLSQNDTGTGTGTQKWH